MKKGSIISNYELDGLRYLEEKTRSNSLILIDYKTFKIDAESPCISFLADRPMFLSGIGINLSHEIDIADRKKALDIILTSNNSKEVGKNLLKHRRLLVFVFT